MRLKIKTMIEPSELRLGNLINNNNKVIEITLGHNVTVTANNFSGMLSLRKQDIIPIQLTEDWLLKFGFEKNSTYENYRLNDIVIEDTDYGICMYNPTHLVKNNIKYVHQLQNLYFAVTGSELISHI